MLTTEELNNIIHHIESDRVEKTISMDKRDKFGETICAFANDLPNHQQSGYLLIGVNDDNSIQGITITDRFLQLLSDFGTDGRIMPRPSLSIQTHLIDNKEIVVVEVKPSPHPPVRYNGNVYIRIGPRKGVASEADERILIEKRTSHAKTFDALPCWDSSIDDLAKNVIKLSYLPLVISEEVLQANHRDFKQQLASLRLFDLPKNTPTNAGILGFGLNPSYYLFGAYIQYIKVSKTDKSLEEILNQKRFDGALIDVLREIDSFIKINIVENRLITQPHSLQKKTVTNYPSLALRELIFNAIIHRDYESNSPIYVYEFSDRIEIHSPGYLYGQVNKHNFPQATDYRNPILAEIVKKLGYVEKFGFGIQNTQNVLKANGNPPAEFDLNQQTKIVVTLKKHELWLTQ